MTKKADDDIWNLQNLEDLLSQLTEEELTELNGDFDPDNSFLPASDRCKDQTTKAPTGPFNRKKLVKFLEEQAKNEKDWEEHVPYKKESKGKKFEPKKAEKMSLGDLMNTGGASADGEMDEDWEEALSKATESELVELAAVLGFHSVMNQDQYYASLENREVEGDFSGVAKATRYKSFPFEPPNNTDVEDAIKRLESNDAGLTELNLNNIRNVSVERLSALCAALAKNTHLKTLQMASTNTTNAVAKVLAESLAVNKTVLSLNLESNFIQGDAICGLLEAINASQTLREIRLSNQRAQTLGVRSEMRIAQLLEENTSIVAFGLAFDSRPARIKAQAALQQNVDRDFAEARKERKK